MTLRRRVLVVAPIGTETRKLGPSLRAAGFDLSIYEDFAGGKGALRSRPELLITELKLGAFNGLHLAIRANDQRTPTIVVGDPDPVLEIEATRQHAAYLTPPLDPELVVGIARQLVDASTEARRSPRKRVPRLDAYAESLHARVLDVSYDGLRLEADSVDPQVLPPVFDFSMPRFNFKSRVQRVWTMASPTEEHFACGASMSAADANTAMEWRTLVDRLPGLAVMA